MAKRRRAKSQSLFYETLSRGSVRPLAYKFLSLAHAKSSLPKNRGINLEDLRFYGAALLQDLVYILGKVAKSLTGVRARIVLLSSMLIAILLGSTIAIRTALATMDQYHGYLSNPQAIMNMKKTGTIITDRNGEVLYAAYGATDRDNIQLNEVPPSLIKATLAAEDPNFYSHPGFSWRATIRAMYEDAIHNGKVQGGSTITQQLVKNTLLTPDKSFVRKYKEILLSIELERRYSKDQILQMYLNSIYYGQGSYGIESAAQTYFHKPVKELSLPESALLAGLPQSPSIYDPNVNPSAAKARRDYVLDRMYSLGYISQDAAATANGEPIHAGTRQVAVKAPHFVFYVLDQLRQTYGADVVERGGITVKTTLDYKKQQMGEEIVKNQVERLALHHATNGGLVSLDPKTGDIITMVGSADYNNPQFGAVNVTLAQLQPGSSFKPIVYATAFTKGWNGATKVDDKPIRIPQTNGTVYAPQNYDQKFRGPVLLRRALANSLNIPAVEVLEHAGIHDSIQMAHALGITTLNEEDRYGLSLVLGGGEVRPIDMAAAYGAFDEGGQTVTPKAVLSVEDKFGKDITKEQHPLDKQVLDPRIAYMITNILSDNKARTEEFGPNSPLLLSRPAAAKTGTTNDFRDNWTVGYTPDLVTAVWVGNNDHTAMLNVDGITGAAPIWHDYMEQALAGTPAHDFSRPAGLVDRKVCSSDGGLVDNNDPTGITEVFLVENQPTKRCGASSPHPTVLVNAQPVQPQPVAVNPGAAPGMGGGNSNPNPMPTPVPTPTPAPTPNPSPNSSPGPKQFPFGSQ
jgi:1A family penicillin-binding protein